METRGRFAPYSRSGPDIRRAGSGVTIQFLEPPDPAGPQPTPVRPPARPPVRIPAPLSTNGFRDGDGDTYGGPFIVGGVRVSAPRPPAPGRSPRIMGDPAASDTLPAPASNPLARREPASTDTTPAVHGHRPHRFPVLTVLLGLLAVGLFAFGLAGWRFVVIKSGSMEPTLGVGALVLSRTIPATGIHPGEIVSFRDPAVDNQLVTHRVVRIRWSGSEATVTTRGDADHVSQTWTIGSHGHVGLLVGSQPDIGRLFAEADSPRIVVALIAAFCLYAIGLILRRLWQAEPPNCRTE